MIKRAPTNYFDSPSEPISLRAVLWFVITLVTIVVAGELYFGL